MRYMFVALFGLGTFLAGTFLGESELRLAVTIEGFALIVWSAWRFLTTRW